MTANLYMIMASTVTVVGALLVFKESVEPTLCEGVSEGGWHNCETHCGAANKKDNFADLVVFARLKMS